MLNQLSGFNNDITLSLMMASVNRLTNELLGDIIPKKNAGMSYLDRLGEDANYQLYQMI